MSQLPTVQSSRKRAAICAAVTSVLMILLRPIFRMSPETTFLGGFFGAVLFFFLVILAGNMNDKHGSNELGWFYLALCEIVSIFVSLFIHPVCITTCFLFSIPVVIYIKWASTKIKNLNKIQKPANAKKNK